MSFRLSPALAEFSEGRWPDERGMDRRQLQSRELNLRDLNLRDQDPRDLEPSDPRSMEPPLHPSELDRLKSESWSVSRWVPVAFVRFMIFFLIGVATTLAWKSYGDPARRMVAHLTPGLGWLAPPAAPAAPSASRLHEPGPAAGASPDQLAAVSRSLAAVRQSVDRLAADVAKLQAAKQDPPVRTSGPPAAAPPVAVSAQGRKLAPVVQAASSR
jgi:hypothetical protein